jgi:hypothetical protein
VKGCRDDDTQTHDSDIAARLDDPKANPAEVATRLADLKALYAEHVASLPSYDQRQYDLVRSMKDA